MDGSRTVTVFCPSALCFSATILDLQLNEEHHHVSHFGRVLMTQPYGIVQGRHKFDLSHFPAWKHSNGSWNNARYTGFSILFLERATPPLEKVRTGRSSAPLNIFSDFRQDSRIFQDCSRR